MADSRQREAERRKLSTAREDVSDTNTKVYNVWFRHDTEPEIESILLGLQTEDLKRVKLEELVSSTQGLTITHMYVDGELPPGLDRIAPHMRQFEMCNVSSIDQLEGLCELINLEMINLSDNNHLASLPDSIGRLKSLKDLDLSACNLTGLPQSIEKLTRLESIDLSYNNELDGVPDSIGNLNSLKSLYLSGCYLTSLPDSLCERTNLETLVLSSNYHLAPLPDSIGRLKSLKDLDLSACNLTGLPQSIEKLTRLESIDLSYNKELDGVPDSIGNLNSLKSLYLSGCNLTSLPDSIGKLKRLESINLAYNKKIDGLPDSIRNLNFLNLSELTNLETLYLSDNHHLASLPDSIGRLKSLKDLDLSYCNLTSLPDSIGKLTRLESINLNYNTELDGLPDSIGNLNSLKSLDLSESYLASLPDSLCKLTNLETLHLSDNKHLASLPDSIGRLESLKVLGLSGCNLTGLPQSIENLTRLESINLSRNKELDGLPDIIGNLNSLKSLYLVNCNLARLPDSLCELTNLETLVVRDNNHLASLPDSVAKLKSLKDLDLSGCNLTELPQSIGNLTRLESINLSRNKDLDGLPDIIRNLNSLKSLYISHCNLARLPDSLCELTNLETLVVRDNNHLASLPDSVAKLKSLKDLDLSACNLTELPQSVCELTNLESLDLSENKRLARLPESLGKLKSLKGLNVSGCNLTGIPQSIGKLTGLESINMAGNNELDGLPDSIGNLNSLKSLGLFFCNLTSLPDSLGALENLESLMLSDNEAIISIPLSIFSNTKLEYLNCEGCEALTSPPYAVCIQGLGAVRQYIEDLKKGKLNNEKVFPVIVIGQSLAGKTSLVLSLQQNKRVLTRRHGESKLDQATKVFKVRQLKPRDGLTVLFYDCGGQAIYHYAYQLTFRTECVVMLVINIAQFDRLASSYGIEAATQQACMDWLAHLYVACPRLGHPIVALTHTEQLASDILVQRRDQLIKTAETLRLRIVRHETAIADQSSPFFSMKSFSDTSRPLLQPDKIFAFTSDGGEAINLLNEQLCQAGSRLTTDIPNSWYKMIEYMTAGSKNFISLTDIEKEFPDDNNHFILQYVHEIGKAMWFRDHPDLGEVVFHRVEILTEMVEVLFSHVNEDNLWSDRVQKFAPFIYQEKTIELRKYKSLVGNFRNTGIMSTSLLTNLLDTESKLPSQLAISLLKSFHIICGPIQEDDSYIIPFFSTKLIAVKEEKDHVQLKADLFLNGLPVPIYSYSLVAGVYIDKHITPFNCIQSGANGVIVEGDGTIKYLLLKPEESRITLITSTSVGRLSESWHSQLSSLKAIRKYLKSVWKAVRIEGVFYCTHCTMAGNEDPTTVVDPKWLDFDNEQDIPMTSYCGDESFICVRGNQRVSIPRPLIHPCSSISQLGQERLIQYIADLQTSRPEPTVTAQAVPEASRTAIDQRDIDQIVEGIKSNSAQIDTEPEAADPAFLTGNQAVYEMTETRGRALIISNQFNGTRAGSEHDYENLKRMFEKFGFVTAGAHRNYNAQDIVEQIHFETQLPIHRDLGAFILVITSHGDEGSIVGSDGVHVRLTDLYDLLSPKHFPAMKGKPKLIVVQACAGHKREMLLDEVPRLSRPPATPQTSGANLTQVVTRTDNIELDSNTEEMSTADLLIMQSSFDTFSSPRSTMVGSPFIRAIVNVFYKFAHKFHVETIAEMVREAVSKIGVEKTDELRAMRLAHPERAYVASMPKTVCTFTELRRLYLRPRARRENHPQAVTHPEHPLRNFTEIIPQAENIVREEKRGNQVIKSAEYYAWTVRKI